MAQLICANFGQTRTFDKKVYVTLFSIHGYLPSCKISEKWSEQILRKRTNRYFWDNFDAFCPDFEQTKIFNTN